MESAGAFGEARRWSKAMTVRDDIDDRAYFTRRAREERKFAATCEDNAAALAHLRMADEYSKRASELTARQPAVPT